MRPVAHFVYILTCADGSLYTGYTTDIERRLAEHNAGQQGKGARYTATRLPVRLRYSEVYPTRSLAMKREVEIKKLTRREKMMLCTYGHY